MAKNAAKIVGFIAILCLLLFGVSQVLKFKYIEGIESMTTFYEQPEDTIDVLVLGSSHSFCDINTGTLFDEYGIAAFDLGGGAQPLANTYFYLKEALKSQQPKLIVLEVFATLFQDDYPEHVDIIKNTFGMAPSVEKWDAKRASIPSGNEVDYYLEYPTYHTRYSSLTKEDFGNHKGIKNRDAWKGYRCLTTSSTFDFDDEAALIEERTSLPPKAEKYLLEIIDFAKERDIPLVLVSAPFMVTEDFQRIINSVSDIALEHDIPFIDFNRRFHEIDFDSTSECSDFYDTGHLNAWGSVKLTRYLGEWIKSIYDIPDRRGEESYESWERDAISIRCKTEDAMIFDTTNLVNLLDVVLVDDRFTVAISFAGDYSAASEYQSVAKRLEEAGIKMPESKEDIGIVIKDGEKAFQSSEEEYCWLGNTAAGPLLIKREEGSVSMQVGFDSFNAAQDGVTVLLIDEITGQVVEVANWPYSNYDSKTWTRKYNCLF